MNNNVSFLLRLKLLLTYISRAAAKYLKINKTIYVQDRIPQYREFWENAAGSLSLEFIPLTNEIWEIKSSERRFRVANFKIPINDPVVFHICADKPVCYMFAMKQNLLVPEHSIFRLQELPEAKAIIGNGGVFVVKPARGTGSGQGVTTQIRTARQLEHAALMASTYCTEFIVEKMVMAESCKLLFLDGQFIHASRRRGVRVTGDGQATIKQLMLSQGYEKVPIDLNAILTLEDQKLSPESVLSADQEVVVRSLPGEETGLLELRTVYNETITDLVCTELAEECARLVREIGCDLASVDVITNDPGKPLRDTGGVFIEINANPGIHHHYNNEDDYRDSVAVSILKYLFNIQ